MARAKKEGNYRFLNVSIEEDVLHLLDQYSEKTHIPKNAITEMALREYLDSKLSLIAEKKE